MTMAGSIPQLQQHRISPLHGVQRSTEEYRVVVQRGTDKYREVERIKEKYREEQASTERYREMQNSTKTTENIEKHREA